MAAQSLVQSLSALGDYHRRLRARIGAPDAVTATAHRLARILYHLVTTRQSYDDSIFTELEKENQQRARISTRSHGARIFSSLGGSDGSLSGERSGHGDIGVQHAGDGATLLRALGD